MTDYFDSLQIAVAHYQTWAEKVRDAERSGLFKRVHRMERFGLPNVDAGVVSTDEAVGVDGIRARFALAALEDIASEAGETFDAGGGAYASSLLPYEVLSTSAPGCCELRPLHKNGAKRWVGIGGTAPEVGESILGRVIDFEGGPVLTAGWLPLEDEELPDTLILFEVVQRAVKSAIRARFEGNGITSEGWATIEQAALGDLSEAVLSLWMVRRLPTPGGPL